MNNKEPGYVYILTNPSFREDWVKICSRNFRPQSVMFLESIKRKIYYWDVSINKEDILDY